ncbi:MAG: alpha-glucan family phosphorylase [Candidatus Omnitrophica bacterium]|nr:alpha-glucan family phosphorylase [Candidatus Omnitrophota bacterium]
MTERDLEQRKIAYFTMEIGLDSKMPTYSGGLGVLAGDTIKSCADLGLPIVVITLLNEKGYFYQRLDENGNQTELPADWRKEDFLRLMPVKAQVFIQGRTVDIQAWEFTVKGIKDSDVPVYFLDANIPENSEYDRGLTSFLYGGDQQYRLCQEVILGIGGVRMLEALGYKNIQKYHMNEGHAGLLTLELLDKIKRERGSAVNDEDIDSVRNKCIFTTHTPVPAGHDRFPVELVRTVLRSDLPFARPDIFLSGNEMNMTLTALNLSRYVNGVAKSHGEVSREMFPGHSIDSITNGIHLRSWVSGHFKKLFDKYIPEWESDYFSLRYALSIPKEEIWQAHQDTKKELIDYVNDRADQKLDYGVFTVGFARRATSYKRADLLLIDTERLTAINGIAGGIQIVYAGKAHPRDGEGKELIKRIFSKIKALKPGIKIVYLENYDMELGRLITSGSDLWLNTPMKPQEASGTSGMKASLNGVPNLSVLDGWWVEGCIESVTGWAIGSMQSEGTDSAQDAKDMYRKLEDKIIPMFYGSKDKWIEIMRHAIALNASFFNTQRMVQEYVLNAYF